MQYEYRYNKQEKPYKVPKIFKKFLKPKTIKITSNNPKLAAENQNIKVGYQGMDGSFCESVLSKFFDIEHIPKPKGLVTSKEVVFHLLEEKIDYGVVAGTNSIAGRVRETCKALEEAKDKVQIIEAISMPVHQCLFIRQNVDIKDIKSVASHIQALKQCENTLQELIPGFRVEKQVDTAISAMLLSKEILPRDTAVVCSKEAGEKYNLKLVKENIEDETSITEFWLLEKNKEVKDENEQ